MWGGQSGGLWNAYYSTGGETGPQDDRRGCAPPQRLPVSIRWGATWQLWESFLLHGSPPNVTFLNSGPTFRAPQPCDHPRWEGAHLHPCPQGPHRQPSLLGLQFGLTAPQKQRRSSGKEAGTPEAHFIHPRVQAVSRSGCQPARVPASQGARQPGQGSPRFLTHFVRLLLFDLVLLVGFWVSSLSSFS